MANEFLREVDEYMHEQRLKDFWQKNRLWLIVAVLVLFAAVAAVNIYKNTKQASAAAASQGYTAIMNAQTLDLESLKSYASTTEGGYQIIANLYAGSLALKDKKYDEAMALYKEVESSSAPQAFKDIAAFMQTIALMETNAKLAEEKLTKITASKSAFKASAHQMLVTLALNNNETEKAKAELMKLIALENAPVALKQQAEAQLNSLK